MVYALTLKETSQPNRGQAGVCRRSNQGFDRDAVPGNAQSCEVMV